MFSFIAYFSTGSRSFLLIGKISSYGLSISPLSVVDFINISHPTDNLVSVTLFFYIVRSI